MAGHGASEIRERVNGKLALCLLAAFLGTLLGLGGCDGIAGDTPRAAWTRAMNSYAERDYGALWDNMADESRQDTIRVLSHVKRDTGYREAMYVKFQIPPETLANMPPREFFIALMTGVERAAPRMIELRAESAKTAEFSRQEIDGNRAVVFWDSARGSEKMAFVFEADRWKPIIAR
jgi:hypothetical protein